MSDDSKGGTPMSGADALEGGPLPSGTGAVAAREDDARALEHPSVPALRARFPDSVLRYEVCAGDEVVVYLRPEDNLEVLGWLKDDPEQRYDLLRDVTAVDFGGGKPLQVVYQLWSVTHRRALRVKCELPLDGLAIPSVEPLWKTANWLEREVFDLFGITFTGHPDLRRILMPHDYAEGHPLRKDFPLRGRFTRAEQTRRALNQDVEHFYIAEELGMGLEPQLAESGDDSEGEG
jgi:NADH-quinone oxidoreductase subunit C